MKTRNGFVSNSSSSSFVVSKHSITYAQGRALLDYATLDENTDGWNIYEDGEYIRGFTIMDNESLGNFLDKVNFPQDKMVYGE